MEKFQIPSRPTEVPRIEDPRDEIPRGWDFGFRKLGFVLLLGFITGCAGQQAETTTTTAVVSSTTTTLASGNIIRLYYTYPTDPSSKEKGYDSQNFGSAYSSDGINFTKDSGIRLGPLANLSDPDFFKADTNQWVLLYSKAVSSDQNENARLYKATSTSPSGTFTDTGDFTGYNLGTLSSTIKIGNTFYAFLVSNGVKIATYEPTSGGLTLYGTATSEGVDPSAIQISSDDFKVFYKSSGDTCMADSSDGLTFTNFRKVVDDAEVPGAVYVNNKIYLYYNDSSSSLTQGKIVVRVSTDEGVTFGDPQEVLGLHDAACDPDPVIYE